MNRIATRLRRALCRHDWQALYAHIPGDRGPHLREKCRKCGVMRRVEP